MSIYRSGVWFVKGLREYTKSGFQSASKNFNNADLEVNVNGRAFMITGANSGIGKCAAIAIAQKGGTVHMVCRDVTRGEEARQEIITQTGNQDVHLHQLDMSKPRDIFKFAKNFRESGKVLDVLINNAGCMVNTREVTEDCLEKNFATNTLGTHVLTTELISLLSEREKPRVITVSSGGMLTQKLDTKDLQFEKMQPFDGTMAYAQNKRQQVVMTAEYAKQYPKVHFSSMHPGWADTPAVRSAMPSFYEKMKTRLRSADEGADTVVWLAMSDAALSHPSGLFYQDRTPVATHLPLAWSKSTPQECAQLMTQLDQIAQQFKE